MGTGKSALEGVGRLSGKVKAWMQEVKRQRGKEMQMSEKRMQNGYVWNALAGAVNASEAVLLSMVVTRTDGIADAGVLSIAFAVGNLMMTIGKFGVRNYQATDLKQRFSFSDYFWARIFTAGVMVLSCAGYLLYCIWSRGYGRYKAVVVAAVCLIYAAESVEDVFRLKGQPYMPMSEHINFYTPKALETLLVRNGFQVLAVQEHVERGVLGKAKVLAAVCRKGG